VGEVGDVGEAAGGRTEFVDVIYRSAMDFMVSECDEDEVEDDLLPERKSNIRPLIRTRGRYGYPGSTGLQDT
jgi:hypothetical protein